MDENKINGGNVDKQAFSFGSPFSNRSDDELESEMELCFRLVFDQREFVHPGASPTDAYMERFRAVISALRGMAVDEAIYLLRHSEMFVKTISKVPEMNW